MKKQTTQTKHDATPIPEKKLDSKQEATPTSINGAKTLVLVLGMNYIVTQSVINLLDGKQFLNPDLFMRSFISSDFLCVVGWFLGAVALSWTSFILIRVFRLHKWPRMPAACVQHSQQLALFTGTGYIALFWDLAVPPRAAVFVEMCVLLLKMHSFVHYYRNNPLTRLPTVNQFWMYLLFPTLVYEPEYPRSDRINWKNFCEIGLMCVFSISVLYVMSTEIIVPVLESCKTANPLRSIMALMLPFTIGYLLIWYIVFECILNGFAEISRFKRREFYQDWWNSTTFAEYNRKWNLPVHEWLRKYIYLECQNRYHLCQFTASLMTFLFSAIFHELFFIVIFRITRLYWLTLMMLQMPLVMFAAGLKGTELGNFVFWQGLAMGIPMQVVLYMREAYGGSTLFWTVQIPCLIIALAAALLGAILMLIKKLARNHGKPKGE